MIVKKIAQLDDKVIKEIFELEKDIFPSPMTIDKIQREISSKYNVSILMAYIDQQAVGYKIGFERSKRIYYSWIGGVKPEFRGRGIASRLMQEQHLLAKDLGYKVVCTQTDNSFKPMLILNLKSGFDIKGTIQSSGDDYTTIILEKTL